MRKAPFQPFAHSDIGQMSVKDAGPIRFCTHVTYSYLCGEYYTCIGCKSLLEFAGGRAVKVRGVGSLIEFARAAKDAVKKPNYLIALKYVSRGTGISVAQLQGMVRK